MAIARALFRAMAAVATGVVDVAQRMNEELARDNEQLMFVTAVIGVLDLATGRVALVDAGHLPPLLMDSAGVRSLDLQVKGPALGVVPQVRYEAAEVALSENAMLVFYTDGVTEARSPAGQLFGDARLTASLSSAAGATADAAVRSVVAAVEHFANGAPQEDDVTMLALRWRG